MKANLRALFVEFNAISPMFLISKFIIDSYPVLHYDTLITSLFSFDLLMIGIAVLGV